MLVSLMTFEIFDMNGQVILCLFKLWKSSYTYNKQLISSEKHLSKMRQSIFFIATLVMLSLVMTFATAGYDCVSDPCGVPVVPMIRGDDCGHYRRGGYDDCGCCDDDCCHKRRHHRRWRHHHDHHDSC